MSIHQTIYNTLNLSDQEVMEMIGSGDIEGVKRRRTLMRNFLESHKWSLESYKAWLRDGSWTPDKPVRGLGDRVAKITHAVGIKGCAGCGSRQRALNRILPKK